MLAALPDHPVLDVFYRTMIDCLLVSLGRRLGIFSDRCLHVKNMAIKTADLYGLSSGYHAEQTGGEM